MNIREQLCQAFHRVAESAAQKLVENIVTQSEFRGCLFSYGDSGPVKGLYGGKVGEYIVMYVLKNEPHFDDMDKINPDDCFSIEEVANLIQDTYLGNLAFNRQNPETKTFGPFRELDAINFCKAIEFANLARNFDQQIFTWMKPTIENAKLNQLKLS